MNFITSADGNYEVTLMTKATLHYNGKGSFISLLVYIVKFKLTSKWLNFTDKN